MMNTNSKGYTLRVANKDELTETPSGILLGDVKFRAARTVNGEEVEVRVFSGDNARTRAETWGRGW